MDLIHVTTEVGKVALAAVVLYAAILGLTRLAGLRSFAKMSSFDFAMTIALGSVVAASVLGSEPSALRGLAALTSLYALQVLVSLLRRRWPAAQGLVDNEPLLLMAHGRVLDDHLQVARLTPDDLREKLRQAGITQREQVLAVVFETTGDVSVLKAGDGLDPWLVEAVRGAERLAGVGSRD